MGPADQAREPSLACVVLAHDDAVHVRRLIDALAPFPVLLHVDSATPPPVHEAMTTHLPERVTLLPRRRTAWGSWELVAAELDGYRAALAGTEASHVALLTGSDYPLASVADIRAHLAANPGRSSVFAAPLPIRQWGPDGGRWRLRFAFRSWRRHPVPVSPPRRLPRGVVPAGGSQLKILARSHAEGLLRACQERPDVVDFWRTTWIPDESFVPSLLHSPHLVPEAAGQLLRGSAWLIGWDDRRRTSPPFLTAQDLRAVRSEYDRPVDGVPKLFARKFATRVDTSVLDLLDAQRLTRPERVDRVDRVDRVEAP